jgi:hypothetical protein
LDYNQEIATLLQEKAYATLESTERKTVLLLKKSSFAEEVCQQVRPQSSRPPRLYGLLKIHKSGVQLRPTVNTNDFPHPPFGPTLGAST